jgi:phosphoenolpyruvate carboxykinase (ATP)
VISIGSLRLAYTGGVTSPQPASEPEIYKAIRFGTVLENVGFDRRTRVVDFYDNKLTENTRACYPIEFIDNAHLPCSGPHPK